MWLVRPPILWQGEISHTRVERVKSIIYILFNSCPKYAFVRGPDEREQYSYLNSSALKP